MTIHPVRLNGVVIGVPQTYNYFARIQERIVGFVTGHSNISRERYNELMMATDELANDKMPVESRLKPMVVTTQAETMGLTKRRQYFAVRPRSPSMQPPTITAPIIRP